MGLKTLFTLVSAMCVVILTAQDEYAWKQVKSQDGITAYVKKNPDTKIRSVRVETIAAVGLSEAVSIIRDAENHYKWVYLNSEAKVLDTIDKYTWVYYGKSDLPWPVSDRDFITYANVSQDSLDYSVTLTSISAPEYMEDTDGCVRIEDVLSKWKLNPLGNGTVHITLELTVDLGGTIPLWFINIAVARGPIQTMTGLLEIIDSGVYQDCQLEIIKEF